MNTKRRLFLLFTIPDLIDVWNENQESITRAGYTLVHQHSYMNDEPPYIMQTFWSQGKHYSEIYPEEGETLSYYLIRSNDCNDFCDLKNEYMHEYTDWYYEGMLLKNGEDSSVVPSEHAEYGMKDYRTPKVRKIFSLPNQLTIPIMS